MRGVSGDDPEGGAGSGVPRLRLVTAGLGRSGTPPARHYDLAARSSLHGSGGNAGDGSAAPGPKSPRWRAERRASRVMGRAAPHQRGWSRLASAATTQVRLSALRPPLGLWTGAMRQRQNPGAERVAGTKNTALFDIVRCRNPPHPGGGPKGRPEGWAATARLSWASCFETPRYCAPPLPEDAR